ncbi:MAG: hypothetical protein K5773_06325 [Pseudobutyrivibrio sp.]|nr:hypothetical protein [Pseudobutyrivibrio sp.]
MINEERVKHMTAMAIFEKECGPEYQPMLKYSKKDYVALHGWGGFIAGTLMFWVAYGLIIIYMVGNYEKNITTMYILLITLIGVLLYAAYIIMHVYLIRKRAAKQYRIGKRLIKERANQFVKLNLMYDNEIQQTRSMLAKEFEDKNEEE